MNDTLLSVGIDIGTTTTQVIFSRFVIKNISGMCGIPEFKITDKKIVYESRIYFTPIIGGKIDIEGAKKILDAEIRNSGFKRSEIKSGAIIITGESARKENARGAVDYLSETAGNFVVTAAGPDLEAVLAGKGAGAKNISEKKSCRILNLDVGGGTTNACLFESGKAADTFALDIGGRVVRLKEDGTVLYVSPRIEPIIKKNHFKIKEGSRVEFSELDRFCKKLAEILAEVCGFAPLSDEAQELFIGHANSGKTTDFITFSGGVAEYIYGNISSAAKYGDIGPLLAQNIRSIFAPFEEKLIEPKEKIRATVIGAGSYTMQISGSTVYFERKALPLRNLPVVEVSDFEKSYNEACSKLKRFEGQPLAITFKGAESPSYINVKNIACRIAELFNESNYPIVVLVQNDFAKALGQILHRLLPCKSVICADGICAHDGDYIDIGFPIRQVLPVVIKTLVFS